MTIDRDLVTRKLLLITEDLDELRRIAAAALRDIPLYLRAINAAIASDVAERNHNA
jgi:hypothetical protein